MERVLLVWGEWRFKQQGVFLAAGFSLVIPNFLFLAEWKRIDPELRQTGKEKQKGAVYFKPVFTLVGESSRHTKNKTLYLANTVCDS